MLFIQLIYFLSCFIAPNITLKEEVCLTTEEQKLYNVIMDYRKEKKLKSIPYSVKLTQVAQAHVRDLVDNYDFSQRLRFKV